MTWGCFWEHTRMTDNCQNVRRLGCYTRWKPAESARQLILYNTLFGSRLYHPYTALNTKIHRSWGITSCTNQPCKAGTGLAFFIYRTEDVATRIYNGWEITVTAGPIHGEHGSRDVDMKLLEECLSSLRYVPPNLNQDVKRRAVPLGIRPR